MAFVSMIVAGSAGCTGRSLDSDSAGRLQRIRKELSSTSRLSNASFNQLKDLFEGFPDSPEVSQLYRDALISRQDWPTLEEYYLNKNFSDLSQDDRRNLAIVLVKLGKFERGLEVLAPLIEDAPDDLKMKGVAASANFSLGRAEEAARILDSVWNDIVRDKMYEEVTLRGIIYLRQGELENAVKTLEMALEINPDHISANYNLARAYRRLGNDEKAALYVKKASDAQRAVKQETYAKSVGVRRTIELEAAWKKKDYRKVIELAEELVSSTDDKPRKLVLYQYIYESYKALGLNDRAETALQRARRLAGK